MVLYHSPTFNLTVSIKLIVTVKTILIVIVKLIARMKTFVAYYRKSPGGNKSKEELNDSLGLDSQKSIVANYLRGIKPLAEFTDLESGKKDSRSQLLLALEMCKKVNAILVIAKLDRLSRDLHFITALEKANIKFVCCDMPDADEMQTHIFGTLAQWERKRISQRTKDALKEKMVKCDGKGFIDKKGNLRLTLGNPGNLTDAARKAGLQAIQDKANSNVNNKQAKLVCGLLSIKGESFSSIAKHLNEAGYKTAKGSTFRAEQVKRLIGKVTLQN